MSSFSFLTHFTAITAGVIDLRDLIFFFSLIALFLTANVVDRRSEEERLSMSTISRRTLCLAAIVLAAVIFVALNIVADASLHHRAAGPHPERPFTRFRQGTQATSSPSCTSR